jgi:hypothetical protein
MQPSIWEGKPERAFLAGKEEDRFTEMLCQILKDQTVLDKFLRQLCDIQLSPAELVKTIVTTQMVVPEGRIDLVIRSPKHLLVFEAKVGSWLHGNQILSYAKFIEELATAQSYGDRRLVLVAPQANLRPVFEAAKRQIGKKFKKVKPDKLSWEQIGGFAQSIATGVPDSRLRFYLGLLSDLIEYRLGQQVRPFRENEVAILSDPTVGAVVFRATQLAAQTVEALKARWRLKLKLTIKPSSGSRDQFFKGFTIFVGKHEFWFGLWIDSWMMCGSPICLQIHEYSGLKRPIPKLIKFTLNGEQVQAVPIPVSPDLDFDKQAEQMADLIQLTLKNAI